MEKAPGVELELIWPAMDIKTRAEFLKSLGRIQKAWASRSFSSYGSLYYPADLENPRPCIMTKNDGTQVEDPHFSIGPSNSREQFFAGRTDIDFDRGPCKSKSAFRFSRLTNTYREYNRGIRERSRPARNCLRRENGESSNMFWRSQWATHVHSIPAQNAGSTPQFPAFVSSYTSYRLVHFCALPMAH